MTQNRMLLKSMNLLPMYLKHRFLKQMAVKATLIEQPSSIKPLFMKQGIAAALLCAASLLAVAQAPAHTSRGTVPRAAATEYAAHDSLNNGAAPNTSPENSSQGDIQIGATLLTKKELKQALASKVNDCCVVVEVAFYPPKNNFVRISLDDFMLRERGMDLGTRPSNADVLAARLEEFPVKPDREHTPGLSRSSDIGYERTGGTNPQDPSQPSNRGGIYQRDSVGIGIPVGGRTQNTPGTNEGAAAAAGNRQAIQAELTEKGLPEIDAWEPVAGYLYFFVPKKSKNGYELVYMMGDKKVVLALK
jgi:hypothetical protein